MTRDDKGRFAKGNSGGPGRPVKAAPQDYIDIFTEVVTADVWREILLAQVRRALRGDIQAFTALANRAMPATNKQEVSGTGGGDLIIRIAPPDAQDHA